MLPQPTSHTEGLTYQDLFGLLKDCLSPLKADAASILIYGERVYYPTKAKNWEERPALCCLCLYVAPGKESKVVDVASASDGFSSFLSAEGATNVLFPHDDPRFKGLVDKFETTGWSPEPEAVETLVGPLLPLFNIAHTVAVPFSVGLEQELKHDIIKCVLTADFMAIPAEQDQTAFHKRIAGIAQKLGQYIGHSVNLLGMNVLSNLSLQMLSATSYEKRLGYINLAATKATAWTTELPKDSDVPRGSFSHIRRFVQAKIPGFRGILSMVSSKGYTELIDHGHGAQRMIAAAPDGSAAANSGEDRSVSVEVFLKADIHYCQLLESGQRDCGKELDSILSKLARIEMIKGSYATLDPVRATPTRSQLTMPILDANCRPLGVLNINSERYGWITPLWLPAAVELAKRAAMVIEQERGYGFIRNVTLDPRDVKGNPSLDTLIKGDEHWHPADLKNRLQELYANPAIYDALTISRLTGLSRTSKTFEVVVHDRHNKKKRINRQVVRFFPEMDEAQKELNAYDFYVLPYLSPSYYCAKVGHAMDGITGAISYAWGMFGNRRPQTLEQKLRSEYIRMHRVARTSRRPFDRVDFEPLSHLVRRIFSQGLKPWHMAGDGAFSGAESPGLLDLYDRDRHGASITDELSVAEILDMQRPGLFALSDVMNKATGEAAGNLISSYEEHGRTIVDGLGVKPTLGICHGDLNLWNILVPRGRKTEPEGFQFIDFDTVHRGHCFQDFARLETYFLDLFLNKLDVEETSIQKDRVWRERVVGIVSKTFAGIPGQPSDGARSVADEVFDTCSSPQDSSDPLPLWATLMLYLVASVRDAAFELHNQQRPLAPAVGDPDTRFAIEYYFAVLCQYVDWLSHDPPSRATANAYGTECERLSRVAQWMAIDPLSDVCGLERQ
jgi:hypothetical protein